MVKVSFKPDDELIIHESQKFDLKAMVRLMHRPPRLQHRPRLSLGGWRRHAERALRAERGDARGQAEPDLRGDEVTIRVFETTENPAFGSAAKWLKGAA